MSGQPRLHSTVISRVAIGLLAGAAMLLLAPVALATPESDADAAITAAWDASGGDTGSLGPRDGGVYPAGEGFGQNFAGGKIFFTPAVGAHIMKGAILEKYEALGGPANSDLGFPTIDEGAGRAPGSLNTTFSAADKPVIFWTPETGARVVRGPINAAWDKLGGSAGRLGVPAEDEAYRGDVVTQKFTGGEISYDPHARTFTTVPPELAGELAGLEVPDDPTSAINAARRAAGGALGPLGAADGRAVPDRRGRPRAELRRRQDLLQPADRCERRDRPGAGQVRKCRRSGGRPGIPDEQRRRRWPGADEPDHHLRGRGQTGHLLDARLRRGHRARCDERGLGKARRRKG